MKRFTEYLNEDFDPAIFNQDGGISIDDPTVVDAINSNLEVSTANDYRTPYNALEEIRKVLAYYKIFLPKGTFLDQNHGHDVFQISQFGEKMGMNNQGEVVTASDSSLFVYFEWSLNEKGLYDTFACVCNQEELDDILDDFESEVEDKDSDLQESHSPSKLSMMLYKAVNQAKADKQKSDVDDYIEHEKQGKTFTQMCEESMPDLKKKMGAKKVTLPNMMRKEEAVQEATLGGAKYKRKHNPNNEKSNKSSELINSKMQASYGKVADASGHTRKRLLQKGHAAFKVGLAKKYTTEEKSDDDKASDAVRKVQARHMLKDVEKSGHKKSPDWYKTMVKRANKKI